MPEYGFSLFRIQRIEDSVLIRKNMGQRKPVFWHILLSLQLYKKSGLRYEYSGSHFIISQFIQKHHSTISKNKYASVAELSHVLPYPIAN